MATKKIDKAKRWKTYLAYKKMYKGKSDPVHPMIYATWKIWYDTFNS